MMRAERQAPAKPDLTGARDAVAWALDGLAARFEGDAATLQALAERVRGGTITIKYGWRAVSRMGKAAWHLSRAMGLMRDVAAMLEEK